MILWADVLTETSRDLRMVWSPALCFKRSMAEEWRLVRVRGLQRTNHNCSLQRWTKPSPGRPEDLPPPGETGSTILLGQTSVSTTLLTFDLINFFVLRVRHGDSLWSARGPICWGSPRHQGEWFILSIEVTATLRGDPELSGSPVKQWFGFVPQQSMLTNYTKRGKKKKKSMYRRDKSHPLSHDFVLMLTVVMVVAMDPSSYRVYPYALVNDL